MKEIELANLPSVSLSGRRYLPKCSAVYFAVGSDGGVLYIGKSKNLRARWVGHHRLDELQSFGAIRLTWYPVRAAAMLFQLERACIARFQPRLNQTVVTYKGHYVPVKTRLSGHIRASLNREARRYQITSQEIVVRVLEERYGLAGQSGEPPLANE